jgi:hypothetical protein
MVHIFAGEKLLRMLLRCAGERSNMVGRTMSKINMTKKGKGEKKEERSNEAS